MATTSYSSRHKRNTYIEDCIEVDASDVDTDSTGDVDITFSKLKGIIESSVTISLEKGFSGHVISVSSNVATVRLFKTGTATNGVLAPVTSSNDVAILHARALGY